MSLINLSYRTNYLHTYFKTTAVIPDTNEKEYPTLFLLHGYTGDDSAWIRHTNIEKLARKYNIAVVMPEARNAFYTDSDFIPYYSFFVDELIDKLRNNLPLATNKAENFIAGSSMGGYGALKIGFKNPDLFSHVAALSPITDIIHFRNNPQTPMANNTFDTIFDSPEKIADNQLVNIVSNKNYSQKIMTICGTDDYMYQDNLDFKNFMTNKIGKNYTWHEVSGNHSWDTWVDNVETIFRWISE
ncbi:alpha/beta hydrolase [Companilactobacillus versmoldensis]|uniref:Acetylesterase n=1 Tax=Companilactobacillus versmoldensis DSM 14857 = KCTC 3814 TaxID=1423815 RepID=A0A0R1SNG1_9LACO|nr:alpha/beta hydrolase family protein [Companilactobacillus versmoldensis]KRL67829.1 acetylesterase [Companilactobacillus versmoldensis DSM 14857 = KCTC 3814]